MDRGAPSHRRRSLFAALAVMSGVIVGVPAVFLTWFFLVSPVDPAPYVAALDTLPVPSAWEVVHTQALRSFMGSRADRYYLVDAEPEEIAPVVEEVLRSAGLEIHTSAAPNDWCDTRPIRATPAIACPRKEIDTCHENGSGGPVSCVIQAFRWLSLDPPQLERLYVYVSARGDSFDVGVNGDQTRVDASNRALVRISADRATARYFWSSPTPRAP